MKSLLFGATVTGMLIVCADAHAADWGHLVAYAQWTNDYRFNGFSESSRQPAPQGGLHWLAPNNFYAGIFVSGVRFKDFRGTSTETDFYAGKHIFFDGNDLNLEALYGAFPDTAGHPSYLPPGEILPTYNFPEFAAELTHVYGSWAISTKLVVEPRPKSHGGAVELVSAGVSYAVTDWLKLAGHANYQWSDRALNGTSWDVGVTASKGWQWAFDLRYYATDIPRDQCFNTNWCQPAVVAKVTYTFAIF